MLAILTDKANWSDQTLLGQLGNKVVLEVETEPFFDYKDITELDVKFDQRLYYGAYSEKTAYSEISKVIELIELYGEKTSALELLATAILSHLEDIEELQGAVTEIEGRLDDGGL